MFGILSVIYFSQSQSYDADLFIFEANLNSSNYCAAQRVTPAKRVSPVKKVRRAIREKRVNADRAEERQNGAANR